MNLYVERAESRGAKNPEGLLLPSPGFTAWSSGVTGVGARALTVADGRLFGLIAGGLWEFNSTGVATLRGTVAQDANPGQIAYNGVVGGQLGICSGGSVYRYTLATNSLSAAVLSGGYTHLGFADGYGLAFNPTTGRVQLSALNDFGTFSGSNFFARSKFPDPWQAMFIDPNGLIWLIGTETFEVWYNTGQGTQPWAPLSGLFGRYGIVAPFAYTVTGLGQFWIATSPEGGIDVVSTRGAMPQPVSNSAMETAVEGFRRTGTIENAEMLSYHDQGQTFINSAFPDAVGNTLGYAPTWTYGIEMESWSERGQWNSSTGEYGLWAPRVHADCFGKHLVGDRTTGTIWVMDSTVSTDVDGNGIRRLRRTPGLTREHQRIPINDFEILMDVGFGTASGQGSDPQALLRVSEDGGNTWGNERRASIGRIGQYRKRVYWTRLGAPQDCVLEVVWSDPSPVRVVDAWVNNFEHRAAA